MTTLDSRRVRRRKIRRDTDGPTPAARTPWLLLTRLDDADRHTLIEAGRGIRMARGGRLSGPGHDALVAVLRGAAIRRSGTTSGEVVISGLLGPGDIHGLLTVLGHAQVDEELVALTDVEALAIPGPTLRALMNSVPSLAPACLSIVAEEHADLRREVAQFTGSSGGDRVEHRLIELARRFGVNDRGRTLVTLPLTQDDLASWAGTSRETCAKALHNLRRTGIVTTGRRQLVIENLAALRARRRAPDPTVDALLRGIG